MREILHNMAATIEAPMSEPKQESVIKSISSRIEVPATLRNLLRFLKNMNFLKKTIVHTIQLKDTGNTIFSLATSCIETAFCRLLEVSQCLKKADY